MRIFTPVAELPFAGHPTLGSCHAWLEAGGTPQQDDVIVQQCGAGLVSIRRTAGGLAFAAPPLLRSGPAEEPLVGRIAAMLASAGPRSSRPQWADNGPGWVAVLLASADAVLALRPGSWTSTSAWPGCIRRVAGGAGGRAFFPKDGATTEDPVTGSLNASLAQWLLGSRAAHRPVRGQPGHRAGPARPGACRS